MPGPSVNPQLALRFEPEKHIFAVSELNSAIRDLFSREFRNIWVTGEVSGCKVAASGHLYFSLKDRAGQIRCVLFKGTARWLKFRPQDGLAVLARGSIDVYEQRGEYQLIIDQLEPQGAGALQLAFEQLKRKLETEGFFAQERKKPLPKLPKRIGIVTSPSGSVIRDILHVLERRFPGLHIRLFPTLVQGAGSIEQVCAGITYFSEIDWAEVIIVARGGGSLEDLWTFNEEAVARAIAGCRIPVISAIGHETDFTIADFVADLRAPTPSAAAELVVTTREGLLQQLNVAEQRGVRAARYQLLIASKRLQERGVQRAQIVVHRALAKRAQQVDDCDFRLQALSRQLLRSRRERLEGLRMRLNSLDLRVRFARAHSRLQNAESALARLAQARLWKARTRCEELNAHLTQLSPLAVLGRGYALVQNANGKLLRSSDEARLGDTVDVRLSQGGFRARVEEIE
ncbi:MAG TPA: exodeoxyribonuclease VII large subunit [Bryobacteraceae bacterium]|nr:exodeoxyribonuclease VII large subunit [Bryobacteraceae bacterium]